LIAGASEVGDEPTQALIRVPVQPLLDAARGVGP
jgi:hypothetical protein